MALGIFTRVCGKNVAGASKVFISEAASVTGVTVTTGEVSAVTGTTPFKRIDAEQDSVEWDQKVDRIGNNNTKVANKIGFDVVPPSKDTNILLNALIDGSPCGLLAIILDGNGKAWLVGYNTTDLKNRPLRVNSINPKTGKNVSDAAGQVVPVELGNECSGLALPFDSTLTAAITGGTSTIIQWA